MNFDRISKMSQMVVGGQVMYKFDHIAVIYIDDRHYFNVYRRYNSTYNIMIEDYNLDLHLHQDHTMRTSLKTILCLADATSMYMCCADSFKHNGPVLTDILDMRWTEIQSQYQAVNAHLSGAFIPSTPLNQMIQPLSQPPPLNIPEPSMKMDPSDHPSMSLKYIDVKTSGGNICRIGCYCANEDDEEYDEEYDASEEESEDENYMLLRSGTVVNRSN
jgi:hypothetical protein